MSTLVLTKDHVPLRSISSRRAVAKLLRGRHYVVEVHPTAMVRSTNGTVMALPLSIAAFDHPPLPERMYRSAPLSNEGLFLRDGFRCAYCGRHESELLRRAGTVTLQHGEILRDVVVSRAEFLTRDHVMPQSRGGKDEWRNCVTSCSTCNGLKANRTPGEAGMPSPGRLRAPTRTELTILKKARRRRIERSRTA